MQILYHHWKEKKEKSFCGYRSWHPAPQQAVTAGGWIPLIITHFSDMPTPGVSWYLAWGHLLVPSWLPWLPQLLCYTIWFPRKARSLHTGQVHSRERSSGEEVYQSDWNQNGKEPLKGIPDEEPREQMAKSTGLQACLYSASLKMNIWKQVRKWEKYLQHMTKKGFFIQIKNQQKSKHFKCQMSKDNSQKKCNYTYRIMFSHISNSNHLINTWGPTMSWHCPRYGRTQAHEAPAHTHCEYWQDKNKEEEAI